jgi:2-dehydro-3-deoxygalactonokinase
MTNAAKPSLICVDWGGSNFRAFLLDDAGKPLDVIRSNQGMLSLSKEQFEPVFITQLQPWLTEHSLPIVMAGMVGSAQGWQDAGYVPCPANLSSLTADMTFVANSRGFKIAIVPGVKGLSHIGQIDVMRGEEVQIIGAISLLQQQAQACVAADKTSLLMCLPGTHSKWANVNIEREPSIVSFSTYMTGELFNVLEEFSLLGKPYRDNKQAVDSHLSAFDLGVKSSFTHASLSHTLFSARTNMLSGKISALEVRSYLSGLLIGAEIADMQGHTPNLSDVCLVGSQSLCELYQRACHSLAIKVSIIDSDSASCSGMLSIVNQAGLCVN